MIDIDINFDEASKEWMRNKKKLTNGRYEYICNYIHSNGKQCRKPRVLIKDEHIYGLDDTDVDNSNSNYYCKQHINKYNKN